MKMRVLMGVLLVLNAAMLAWQFDAFARWGWGPNVGREPERLQQQVQPEVIKFSILEASEAPAVATSEAASQAATPAPVNEASAAQDVADAASAAARAARKRARAAAAAAAAAAASETP